MSNVLPMIEMPAPAPKPSLPKVPSAPPILENPDGDKDLIDMYNANGTQAIEKLYTEDMVINTGDLGYHIQDILSIGILTNQDKWNKISKLLFDASLIEKVH